MPAEYQSCTRFWRRRLRSQSAWHTCTYIAAIFERLCTLALLTLIWRIAGMLWAALQQGRYHDASGVPKLHAILATAIEVAEGVAYMHSHRVVHRDLTSGNILLMHEPVAQRVKAKVG